MAGAGGAAAAGAGAVPGWADNERVAPRWRPPPVAAPDPSPLSSPFLSSPLSSLSTNVVPDLSRDRDPALLPLLSPFSLLSPPISLLSLLSSLFSLLSSLFSSSLLSLSLSSLLSLRH